MDMRQAIQYGLKILDDISDSPRIDTELLLCKVIGHKRTFLYSHPHEKLTPTQTEEFQALLDIRQQSIPMAYILGEKEFWSMMLKVGPHTLIPRPATESLIEYILQLPLPPKACICDLGTGTGAIAISLAKEKPNWQVTATDIQSNAIAMAMHNAQRHHLSNICFIWSNWFLKLYGQQFDLIVSNPPYIHPKDSHLYRDDVQHEPRIALASDDEGLFDLKKIIKTAHKYLYPQGILVLEHGYDQQSQVLELFKKSDYQNVQGFKDNDGLARFCVGTRHA